MGHKTKLVIRLAIGKKTKNPKIDLTQNIHFIQHFDPNFCLRANYSCYIILYVKFTTPSHSLFPQQTFPNKTRYVYDLVKPILLEEEYSFIHTTTTHYRE